ncbi:hypothetical protein [Ktedonobacter racemifer]|uniref:hypothetical protein n=1 Tax=Ktedonobacter racemifer TaxID=363277 RepID=UPI0012FC912F|nr:hypothetical protein [Ktedonobacter racemifer]
MVQCHYCEEARPPLYIVHELRRGEPLPEPLHVCQACRYDPELKGTFISRHFFHEYYPHLVRTPAHQGQAKRE